jgi:hypothetical protein
MTELPNWVYDVVMDLQAQQSHPKLLFTSGGFEGTAKYEWCPCMALGFVPAEVKAKAAAIAAYRREAERDETDPEAAS